MGSAAQPTLSVTLKNGETCEVYADRIVAGGTEYSLAELTWAGLVVDPNAPPSTTPGAPPPPAVALRLRDGRGIALAPAEPPAAWQLLGAIFAARPDLRGPVPPPYGAPMYGYGYAPPPQASNNDNVLAGLAHLSVFFGAVIVPLIIWLVTRNSSPYASKQGKQAFFFHLFFFVLSFVVFIVWFVGFFAFLFSTIDTTSPSSPPTPPDPTLFLGYYFALYGVLGVLGLVQIIFSVIGAVKAFQGKPFHYPLLGRL